MCRGRQPGGENGDGSGALSGAGVASIVVSCVVETYVVGGLVSGLAAGTQVSLQNNGGETIAVNADGVFAFTAQEDGTTYAVTVSTQPTNPSRGTLAGADVDMAVACTIDQFTVSGTVTGLAADASVTIANNGQDAIEVGADGGFAFLAQLDESPYAVTASIQPANQLCTVSGGENGDGTGTLAGANVTDIVVTCVTQCTVGGWVTGLASNASVWLQNNGGDALEVNSNTSFVFPAQDDGTPYAVTVATQPSSPSQTCTITGGDNDDGTGVVAGANVATIQVDCVTNTYQVRGQLSGLAAGNSPQDDHSAYEVTVSVLPSSPTQSCNVTNGSGSVDGADVTNVAVECLQVWFVDVDGDDSDGSSWATAFHHVQSAVDAAAATAGKDHIWVADGAYKATAANLPVAFLRGGEYLYGGFEGHSGAQEQSLAERPQPLAVTTLDGDFDGTGTPTPDDSVHVVVSTIAGYSTAPHLHGLVVAGGFADNDIGVAPVELAPRPNWGAGLYVDDSQIYLEDVVFDANVADSCGGAIGAYNYSVVNLAGSMEFVGNSATNDGGAMWLFNSWVSQAWVEGVRGTMLFGVNEAGRSGGAVFATQGVWFDNVTFSNNSAVVRGGAVYAMNGGFGFENALFIGNTTSDTMGGGGGPCRTPR